MIDKFRELVNVICNVDTSFSMIEHDRIVNVISFIQTWSDTALGFEHIFAGSAITPAYTTVIETIDEKFYIFFDGKFAYCVDNPTDEFRNDLSKLRMASVSKAKEKY